MKPSVGQAKEESRECVVLLVVVPVLLMRGEREHTSSLSGLWHREVSQPPKDIMALVSLCRKAQIAKQLNLN